MAAASREHDVRQGAIDLLVATGQFDDVYHYSTPEDRGQRAGDLRAALVAPVKSAYSIEWDDATTGEPYCRHTFNVVVMARHDDPSIRDSTADQLAAVAMNALNGASLAGLTNVQQTLVTDAVWLPEKPPERQVRLTVQAAYFTPGWNSFNTAD